MCTVYAYTVPYHQSGCPEAASFVEPAAGAWDHWSHGSGNAAPPQTQPVAEVHTYLAKLHAWEVHVHVHISCTCTKLDRFREGEEEEGEREGEREREGRGRCTFLNVMSVEVQVDRLTAIDCLEFWSSCHLINISSASNAICNWKIHVHVHA